MRALTVLALSLTMTLPLVAKNGAFRGSAHGDRDRGPQRLGSVPRGSCRQCHLQHASHDAVQGGDAGPKALFAQNDNELCFACHSPATESRVWPGMMRWPQSAHGGSTRVVWPGPEPGSRRSADAGKCVNCHDPHAVRDAKGVVPSMLILREAELCQRCHDGSRGSDVRSQFLKSYRHPIGRADAHQSGESDPSRFAANSGRRHAECSDCHNPHAAESDLGGIAMSSASARLSGVSRVQATAGALAANPIYTWKAPDDASASNEYEICFKCHSGWTRQPPGQADLAALTDPANASFHPVQAVGKNRIDAGAFANGWSDDRQVSCSDCHGSDDARVRGPHGSAYRYILRKPATVTTSRQSMQSDDLCFDCHSYDVYARPDAPADTLRASRFNGPAAAGHAYHVGGQQVPCFICHETHGSVRNPALIATHRGIVSFTRSPEGGSCMTSCHPPRHYTVNYRR